MLTKAAFIWSKIQKKIVKYNVKKKYIYEYILKCNLFLYDGKAEFSAAITPVFSVTWSFRYYF